MLHVSYPSSPSKLKRWCQAPFHNAWRADLIKTLSRPQTDSLTPYRPSQEKKTGAFSFIHSPRALLNTRLKSPAATGDRLGGAR